MTDPISDDADMMDDELRAFRWNNFGRLLDRIHVGFDKLALTYLHEEGFEKLTAAQFHVVRVLQFEGASITSMAERAGISKQAMSKLVASFVERDYVTWVPATGHATKQIAITEKGRQLMKAAIAVIARVEDDFFATLTQEERETLRNMLQRVTVANESISNERMSSWRRRRS
ncbi:MarR family transcriptional regulator [Martelella alba]|uniref:MarR family transcriptional regulator n=1 Tax=Martelella alba TaxID=2590451 RepID=A0A506U7J6_9HYPH|nr:MarR family transcriptional regulator [Martelella alba]TPW29054.1 MarR family transcriptional regulator [Martelella alba]